MRTEKEHICDNPQCGEKFLAAPGNVRWCPKCAMRYKRESTMRSRLRVECLPRKRKYKQTSRSGYSCHATAMETMPDHAKSLKRDKYFTTSDLLHAPVEKSLKMLTRILSGEASIV